ncbi:phage tail protein, partial [Burkholderia multivorans]|uniref:phage tail protein n=1 Tax=Burkholderia multivorans TaxID=87883 RepID=UPI000AF94CF2
RLTDRHKTTPYFKRVLVSSDTWGRSSDLCRDGFKFQAELLDNGKSDVEILLKLTERVGVTEQPDGFEIRHFGEPPIAGT